jgi:hypothetical protein
MKKLNKTTKPIINPGNHTVLYTVKTSTLNEGTIECFPCPDSKPIKVGDFERNVQFVDIFGNNMGRDGYIEEIISTHYYAHGEWIECDLESN